MNIWETVFRYPEEIAGVGFGLMFWAFFVYFTVRDQRRRNK
jgi:hypothetical protein